MEGSDMFEEMIKAIKEETVKLLFHVRIERAPERVRVAQETAAVHPGNTSESDGPKAPIRNEDKHGRNELCSCGSGKKYKNCCGREA